MELATVPLVSGALQAYAGNPMSSIPGLLAASGTGHVAGKIAKYAINRAARYYRGGRVVPYRRRNYSRKRSYRYSRKRSRRKFKRRRFQKSAKRQCRVLARKVNQDTGELTYRARATSREATAVNVQSAVLFPHNTVTNIEAGPCTKLYYYDPSTPGTLLNPDYTTGVYSRELNVMSSGIKVHAKNNSKGDVVMKAYLCFPKTSTTQSPVQDWTSRCADNPTTPVKETIGLSPMDLRGMNWNYKLLKRKLVRPGQSVMLKHFTKGFNYKPARTDVQSDAYDPLHKACAIMVVQHGVVSHDDTSTNLVGISEATLDYEVTQIWKVQYAAGVNIKYTYDANTYQSMATGSIQAQKPAPSLTLATV